MSASSQTALAFELLRQEPFSSKKFRSALKKVSVNEQEGDRLQTMLHVAATNGHVDAARMLLKQGADPNIQDMNGWTALHCAADGRHLDVVKSLLNEAKGLDVNALTIERASVLHYLVRFPKDVVAENQSIYKEVFELLVAKGANLTTENVNGEGPLHAACWKGNICAVELLLNCRADSNMATSYGETPLHYAVRSGQKEIVQLLARFGAEPTLKSENGKTPIDLAGEFHQMEIMEMLVELRDLPFPAGAATIQGGSTSKSQSVGLRHRSSSESKSGLVVSRIGSGRSSVSSRSTPLNPSPAVQPAAHTISASSLSPEALSKFAGNSSSSSSTATSASSSASSAQLSQSIPAAPDGSGSPVSRFQQQQLKRSKSELIRRSIMGRPKSGVSSDGGSGHQQQEGGGSLRPRSSSSLLATDTLVKYPDYVHSGKLHVWTSLPSNKKLKWQRHFFVLTKSAFLHFEADKQAAPLQTFPTASFSSDVACPTADDKRTHLFAVRKQNIELVLSADSPNHFNEWLSAFQSLSSPSPQPSPRGSPRLSPRSPRSLTNRCASDQGLPGSPSSSSSSSSSAVAAASAVVRATMYKEISESITDGVRKDIENLFNIIDADESENPAAALADFLLDDRHRGVQALCKTALISFSDEFMEEFSQKLVKYFGDMDKDVDLIRWAVTTEVLSAGSTESPFRATNIYTQLLSSYFYSKLGRSYLFESLSKLVQSIAISKKALEVDKTRLTRAADIPKNLKRLLQHTSAFLDALFGSTRICPVGFRQVIQHARDVVSQLNPDMGRLIPGGFFFLRLVCPAIVSPVRWGLCREQPTFEGRRTLLLIAKILQNLANAVEFDGTKEAYMVPCNLFLKQKSEALTEFFTTLLDPESVNLAARRQRVRLQTDATAKFAIQTQFLFYLRLKISPAARHLLNADPDAGCTPCTASSSAPVLSPRRLEHVLALGRALDGETEQAASSSSSASSSTQHPLSPSSSSAVSTSPPSGLASSSSAASSSDLGNDPLNLDSTAASSSTPSPDSPAGPSSSVRRRKKNSSRLSHLTSLFTPLGSEPADDDSEYSDTEPASDNEEDLWEHQVASAQNYKFFAAKKVKPLKQLWPNDRSWLQAAWPAQSGEPSKLVDLSCLACGYSIEWGSPAVNGFDPDQIHRIEDEEMSTSFYSDYLRSRDHVNYIATYVPPEPSDQKTTEEADPWERMAIISIEKGGRRGGGEDLKAIIRYPGYDDRVFVSVPLGRTSSFTFSSDKTMMRPIRRKDNFIKPLTLASPPLAKLNLERIENEDLAAELETWELRNVKRAFKFGFLLHLNNQTDEDEMYSNSMTKKAEQFLDWIGNKVKLEGFTSYRGGLDVKRNATGEYSYFTRLEGYEIMFHVAPLLPFDEKDLQRLEKKRHLGNDVLLIVFSESTEGFIPQNIHSHFNHVFAVVRPTAKDGGPTQYEIAFVQKDTVGPFGPFLAAPAVYPKTEEFRQFFLKKLINAERRALEAAVFEQKNRIARKKLIEDMVEQFSIASRR